jgi:hypothetical protein
LSEPVPSDSDLTADGSRRPKKPAGWYSKAAKDERRAASRDKRRKRLAAERARRRRNRHRLEALRKVTSGIVKSSARRMAPIILAEAIALAKEPVGKKAKKHQKAKVQRAAVIQPRTVDNIAEMERRGQIQAAGARAAERFRDAFEAVSSQGISGTLDPDRGSGGGSTSAGGPGERVLILAGDLNDASRVLGSVDTKLVEEIVGRGRTVEEYARARYGAGTDGRVRRRHLELVRGRLSEALGVLAVMWKLVGRERSRIVVSRSPDSRLLDEQKSSIERMAVAHAAPGRSVTYGRAKPSGSKGKQPKGARSGGHRRGA